MTLNLLLAARSRKRQGAIFADPTGRTVEPVVAGLITELGAIERVVFPLPDETTRRHATPPALLRSKHADLWHALGEDERSRVLLVAGPTAALLAPLIGPQATTVVAVRDPEAAAPTPDSWRFVLGPFPELDEVPAEEPGTAEERDRWFERISSLTDRLDLVRASELASITREVAASVGLGPKRAGRTATATAALGADGARPRDIDKPAHWLEQALYELSRPLELEPPRKRRGRQRARAGQRHAQDRQA